MLSDDEPRLWVDATQSELVVAQILAIEAWHRTWPEGGVAEVPASRDARGERARQMHALEAIRDAMRAQTAKRLKAAPAVPQQSPRVVVAHRHAWFVDRLSQALEDYGIAMVARLNNGAEALGVTVAEQPDLLLIEDAMPLVRGEDVLKEVQQFAPRTLVAIQVDKTERARRLTELGADAALSRTVPPPDVAGDLAALVALHRI
jgi:CheY-like chemotaxis protein